jgi:hypothetical protein
MLARWYASAKGILGAANMTTTTLLFPQAGHISRHSSPSGKFGPRVLTPARKFDQSELINNQHPCYGASYHFRIGRI